MAALAVVVFLLVVQHASAAPPTQPGSTRKPSNPFGRRGVEIWGELPRVAVPLGSGYDGQYDISPGWGFGLGIGFGFFNNALLEGRAAMTTHTSSSSEEWDLDFGSLGVKYVFLSHRRAQPYLGLGYSRQTLELSGDFGSASFERITGRGWTLTAGVDYFITGRWLLSVRSDYTILNYNELTEGIGGETLEDPLNGNSLGICVSIGWRIPAW